MALLDEVRPRRVLFTTFTFSPGWFDAFCFPVLRLSGCESVEVLIDSRQACRSTDESGSLYAGNAYRIVPVFMKSGGFFHPKLAYMEREDGGDVLVVGSGNLTFAGQAQNLEVVDAVNSLEHPLVFQQFADFVDAFAAREGLTGETRELLGGYARRARVAASAGSPEARANQSVWLVHTLTEPVADQFSTRCADLGAVHQLTVLAPYHDCDASAVAQLAGDSGAQILRVGLSLPGRIAPFDKDHNELPEDTTYVVADTFRPGRFAHAKVFEAVSPAGCTLMTGSVNATSQSLYSTDNVEVALIRRVATTPFQWNKATPEDFVPNEYDVSELAIHLPALDAIWRPDGVITGVVAPMPPVSQCSLEVWNGVTCEHEATVTVADDGDFATGSLQSSDAPGSRLLKLKAGSFVARGWLNVETELRMSPRDRQLVRAAARVSAGMATGQDLWAIYDVLREAMRTPSMGGSTPRHSTVAENVEPVVQKASTTTYVGWSDIDFTQMGASNPLEMQCLTAAFKHLNGDLARSGGPSAGHKSAELVLLRNAGDEFGDEATAPGTNTTEGADTLEDAQAAMLDVLPDSLARDATHPLLTGAVTLAASEALKRAFARRRGFATSGNSFFAGSDLAYGLDSWLTRFSAFDYGDGNRQRLISAFCTLACCAVYYAKPATSQIVCGTVKEAVRALAGYVPDEAAWTQRVQLTLPTMPFVRVPVEDRVGVAQTAALIAKALTTREQLEQLIVAIFTDKERPDLPVDTYGSVIQRLEAYRKKPPIGKNKRVFGVVKSANAPFGCPGCFVNIKDTAELGALRSTQALVHNCQRVIFLGLDVSALRAALPSNIEFGVVLPEKRS